MQQDITVQDPCFKKFLKGLRYIVPQTYRYLICLNMIFRSSRPEVFSKKGVRRNFAKFTGKHLRQSPETRPATLLKKRLWRRCFPVNFAKFLRTPLQNTSWRLLQLIDSLFQSFRYKQVFNFFCELVKFLNMCTLQEPSNSQFMFHCSLTSHILILVVCCKNPRRVARTPL